ncbi:hypothetical protein ABH930_002799 [Kitasatospora sp. GAS204A]|nr:hypothetical protein [Kitasatospora sp. GAS204B]
MVIEVAGGVNGKSPLASSPPMHPWIPPLSIPERNPPIGLDL